MYKSCKRVTVTKMQKKRRRMRRERRRKREHIGYLSPTHLSSFGGNRLKRGMHLQGVWYVFFEALEWIGCQEYAKTANSAKTAESAKR